MRHNAVSPIVTWALLAVGLVVGVIGLLLPWEVVTASLSVPGSGSSVALTVSFRGIDTTGGKFFLVALAVSVLLVVAVLRSRRRELVLGAAAVAVLLGLITVYKLISLPHEAGGGVRSPGAGLYVDMAAAGVLLVVALVAGRSGAWAPDWSAEVAPGPRFGRAPKPRGT